MSGFYPNTVDGSRQLVIAAVAGITGAANAAVAVVAATAAAAAAAAGIAPAVRVDAAALLFADTPFDLMLRANMCDFSEIGKIFRLQQDFRVLNLKFCVALKRL